MPPPTIAARTRLVGMALPPNSRGSEYFVATDGTEGQVYLSVGAGGSSENAGVDQERSHVAYWPFSTHAAIYADVGFRATAEVLEENKQARLLNDALVDQA